MAFKHKGYNKHGWPFKDETDHEKHHNMNENRDGNDAEGKPLKSGFKMKGSPMKRNFGIGAESPMKQTTQPTYSGVTIDPTSSYDYKDSPKIPSFRDIVSLEQQQAYADKADARRAKKKEIKEWEKTKEAGGGTLDELETKEEERRKKLAEEPSTEEVSGRQGEVKPKNEINISSNADSYGTGTSNIPTNPYA